MAETKKCTSCGIRRRNSRFDADATRPDGLYSHCKNCKHTPERRKQINSIRGAAHKQSLKSATEKGNRWTPAEDKIVLRMSIKDAAFQTGRSYWATSQRRHRLNNGLAT